jgi:small conductance mechanosensitive channel
MKRFFPTLVALLLLLMPVMAQEGVKSVKDFEAEHSSQSMSSLESKGKSLLSDLEDAGKTQDDAEKGAAAAPDDAAAKTALEEANGNFDRVTHELSAIANLIDDKDGDTKEIRMALMEATGNIADLDFEAGMGLFAKWFDQGKTWLTDNGPAWIVKIVVFLIILLVFKILASILSGITRKTLSTSKLQVSDLLRKFFVNIVRKLVFLIGLMIALGQVGVDIGPLLAGIGVIGFVVGFALQDTLSNFASGIMILVYRPYDINDWITAAGETGRVDAMSLVSTTVMTGDNQKLIVPNSAIWGGTIRNITAQPTRRVDMTIGVGYGDDLDKAQEVLMDVITSHELVMTDPAPVVQVANLGDSSVDFIVRPWVKSSDYWTVLWDLTKSIKQRLDTEGLSIPFPQSDLHLVEVPEGFKQDA